jgi:hypothetical protein
MATTRRTIAEKLLERIDGYKEQLRGLCEASGEGFTEEVEGVGSVEVKAGTDKRFKGIVPELAAQAFLEISKARQQKLIDDKLVVMTTEYSPARKPSVTVRL